MRFIFGVIFLIASIIYAHPNFTGYSGAPGSNGTCASSCHGSGTGTITITGFPSTYQPLSTYRIVINHNGGSKIYNLNASTRIGSATTTAGTFTPITNSTTYSDVESGVHASSNLVDSVVFQWTAPESGGEVITLYIAGLQGSYSGVNTKISIPSSPLLTSVNSQFEQPAIFELSQNYPNPFNPVTFINYSIPVKSFVILKIYNVLGNETETLVNEVKDPGFYKVEWNAAELPSGIYFYKLQVVDAESKSYQRFAESKKLILLK
jgi:hypothetical protein